MNNNLNNNQIVGYDPHTGQPIYANSQSTNNNQRITIQR